MKRVLLDYARLQRLQPGNDVYLIVGAKVAGNYPNELIH
jgi:hypothetical protein